MVQAWLDKCDYPHKKYIQLKVGEKDLADDPKRNKTRFTETTLAAVQFYTRALAEWKHANTEHMWLLDDDVIPPVDTVAKLMMGFDNKTISVSGVYRYAGDRWLGVKFAWCVWNKEVLVKPGTGIQSVFGNGLGCTLLQRMDKLDFSYDAQEKGGYNMPGLDVIFYNRQRRLNRLVKVNWDVMCDHLENKNDLKLI